jgi:hypothetical protein
MATGILSKIRIMHVLKFLFLLLCLIVALAAVHWLGTCGYVIGGFAILFGIFILRW